MIPTIEEILKMVADGDMTQEDANHYIELHLLNARERANEYSDDYVRNGYIEALLRTVPPGVKSDSVATFVWDVAQRLMDLRQRGVPLTEAPPPPETPEQKIKRLENELAQREVNNIVSDEQMQNGGKPIDHDDGPY